MSQEAPKTSVAVVRSDALSYVDVMKSLISVSMHADTPVICLACQNSN